MSELILNQKINAIPSGHKTLQLATNFWFITAVVAAIDIWSVIFMRRMQ